MIVDSRSTSADNFKVFHAQLISFFSEAVLLHSKPTLTPIIIRQVSARLRGMLFLTQ